MNLTSDSLNWLSSDSPMPSDVRPVRSEMKYTRRIVLAFSLPYRSLERMGRVASKSDGSGGAASESFAEEEYIEVEAPPARSLSWPFDAQRGARQSEKGRWGPSKVGWHWRKWRMAAFLRASGSRPSGGGSRRANNNRRREKGKAPRAMQAPGKPKK